MSTRKKKISQTVHKTRKMKTFAELTDGRLIEYSISNGWEDEYGTFHDMLYYSWKQKSKEIEDKYNKKIVATISKVIEKTNETIKYSKGENVDIYETTISRDKEFVSRMELKYPTGMFERFKVFHDNDPDDEFAFDKKYIKHFGLKTDNWGKIITG